jgi:hypothetical protein
MGVIPSSSPGVSVCVRSAIPDGISPKQVAAVG